MAIRMDFVAPKPFRDGSDVKIVWKGGRIAKLVFPSGRVVEFEEPVDVGEKEAVREEPAEDGRGSHEN